MTKNHKNTHLQPLKNSYPIKIALKPPFELLNKKDSQNITPTPDRRLGDFLEGRFLDPTIFKQHC